MTEKPKATMTTSHGVVYDVDFLSHKNPDKPTAEICHYDVSLAFDVDAKKSYVLVCIGAFGIKGVSHGMWAGEVDKARQLAAAILRAVELAEMPDFPPQEDIAAALQKAMQETKKEGAA